MIGNRTFGVLAIALIALSTPNPARAESAFTSLQPQPPGATPPGPPASSPRKPPTSSFYLGVAGFAMPGVSMSKRIVGDGATDYPEAAAIENVGLFGWQLVVGFRLANKRLGLQLASGFAGATFSGPEASPGIGGGLSVYYHLQPRGSLEPFLYCAFQAFAVPDPEPGAVRLQGDGGGGVALHLFGRNWLRLAIGFGGYWMDYTDTDWTLFIPRTDGAEISGTTLVTFLTYQRYL